MRITGHALIDVGEATVHSMAGQPFETDLTDADLQMVADWLAEHYTAPGPLQNLIRGAAFFNAGYYSKKPESRKTFADKVLYSWREDQTIDHTSAEGCAFCNGVAAYRANREHFPLLNGRGVFNFAPAGQAGLPICGRCSLAIQALPLGCLKASGRLIAAHSDDPRITYALARDNVRNHMQVLSLPNLEKIPNLSHDRTRFVEIFVKWLARLERRNRNVASLTGYSFTNYGAKPYISIFRMNVTVIRWIESLIYHPHNEIRLCWWMAVESAWKDSDKATSNDERANRLYETLLQLPDGAIRFFRTFVMPRQSWAFAKTYLEEIMQMTPEELKTIYEIGMRFANYAKERKAFFYDFSREDNFASWRRKVLRATDDCSKRYGYTLISFDEFTSLFVPQADEINNWRLVRDLMTLIMIESRVGDEEPLFDDETEDQVEGLEQ